MDFEYSFGDEVCNMLHGYLINDLGHEIKLCMML